MVIHRGGEFVVLIMLCSLGCGEVDLFRLVRFERRNLRFLALSDQIELLLGTVQTEEDEVEENPADKCETCKYDIVGDKEGVLRKGVERLPNGSGNGSRKDTCLLYTSLSPRDRG